MARAAIVAQTLEGAYGDYGANEADITLTAADTGDGNYTVWAGSKLLIIADNPSGGALTLTVTSVANRYGRSGDITTYSIGAGELAIFGPFEPDGWMQSNGQLYYAGSSADLDIAVIALD